MVEAQTVEFTIRHYQEGEEQKMAALVNACRVSDTDGVVTVDMIRDEWHDSRLELERDTWVAVNERGDYVAVAEVWFNDPDNDEGVVTRHIGFAMHPAYRETHPELLEELLARALEHARSYPLRQPNRRYVLRAWASAQDRWKHEVALAHGFQHDHIGYTMVYEAMDALPPIPTLAGVRLEGWNPARDKQLWQALNEAFSTDETFYPLLWEEWLELYHFEQTDPDLWCLAIDEEHDEVIGLALNELDREANRETGRKEGWVVDLGVVPAWRGRGLGRMLLLAAMHTLRNAGATAVKLGLDSDDPANATRLYESLGFRVLQGSNTYHKPLDVRE